MNKKRLIIFLALVVVTAFLLAACSPADPAEDEHNEEGNNNENMDMDEHPQEDHVSGHDYVPEEAAEVSNPFEATEESIALGAELYANTCAICHGETGEGDGPGGEGLEHKPADLHDEHVQSLSDGALYYIISHGKPDTPMPAWESVLEPEERWHVVNFILSLVE